MTFFTTAKLNLILVAIGSVFFISSCNSEGNGYTESSNGLTYKIITDNKQPKAKVGDYVQYLSTIRTTKDSVLFSLNTSNAAQLGQVIAADEKGDPIEILTMLGKGDSASCLIPAEVFFKDVTLPASLRRGDKIKMDLKIVDVFPKEQYELKMQEIAQAKIAAMDAPALDYIKAHNLNAQRLPSGMYYVTENPGTGAQPVSKKQVTVNYRGTLFDGTEFDSSLKPGRTPFSFVLNTGQVIRGWDEGIPLFKVGGKGTLIIPPAMGYGEQGQQNIPPNSWLVFDIEVLGVSDAPQQHQPVMIQQ